MHSCGNGGVNPLCLDEQWVQKMKKETDFQASASEEKYDREEQMVPSHNSAMQIALKKSDNDGLQKSTCVKPYMGKSESMPSYLVTQKSLRAVNISHPTASQGLYNMRTETFSRTFLSGKRSCLGAEKISSHSFFDM